MELLGHSVGSRDPLFVVAGPCALEDEGLAIEIAGTLRELARRLGFLYVFKGSFDKANRTSHLSPRGPGLESGLRVLDAVRRQLGVAVLTDVHESTPVDEVAAVADLLQVPAFLIRQTDFVQRVAATGKPVNLKKAQFVAPWDMKHVVDKCRAAGNHQILISERGTCFGYNALVADMSSLAILRSTGCPVVFDATHSVQRPSGAGVASGGDREQVPVLARAAVAAGVAGVFLETHPKPETAPSDGTTMWPLAKMSPLLEMLVDIDKVVKAQPYLEEALP